VVDYVYPTAQSRARTISVRLRVSNPDLLLKPNMYADIAIDAAPKADVLIIPQAALIRSSQGDRVILALGDGRFRPARVRAGIESGDQVEILDGLEENERVVVSSQFLIDSEASFDAALLRLTAADTGAGAMQMGVAAGGEAMSGMEMGNVNNPAQEPDRISAVGTIQSIDQQNRSVMLTHEPIPELSWPSMTMGFSVADNLSIERLEEGARIRFEFRQSDNEFEILNLEPLTPEAAGGAGP
jgi:Cu(I)/Ag(I) efflux system membrane fusion protein